MAEADTVRQHELISIERALDRKWNFSSAAVYSSCSHEFSLGA